MIDNEFEISKLIGMGGSSKVFLAQNSFGQKVAIKAIRKDKNYTKSAAASMLQREHEMLQKLADHPNVIKSLGINFDGVVVLKNESESIMYNVLEYAPHGALSNFVRYTGGIEEEIARLYVLQFWDAISFIHNLGYAHLDVKLENILLDKYFNIKVADMASWVPVRKTDGLTNIRRGTLLYMAPEVNDLKKNQEFNGTAADIYSLGVTIFVMLTGEFPNLQESKINHSTCISDKRTAWDSELDANEQVISGWRTLSKEVKLLIQSMLNPDPLKRPNIFEVLQNSWLSRPFSSDIIQDVYQEMNSRKEYILHYCKNKQNKKD